MAIPVRRLDAEVAEPGDLRCHLTVDMLASYLTPHDPAQQRPLASEATVAVDQGFDLGRVGRRLAERQVDVDADGEVRAAIAQLAGLSVGHIRQLAEHSHGGPPTTQRVRPSTATRVLSLGIHDASRAPHSRVSATGTRRRLQALMAIGWPIELLAEQLGRRPKSLQRGMLGASVTARTARDMASLYERLWNATPPRATSKQRWLAKRVLMLAIMRFAPSRRRPG